MSATKILNLVITYFLCLLTFGCATTSQQTADRQPNDATLYHNRLLPFSSDGCSRFPDGIPYYNEKKWLHCCIEHDVAYWAGGTQEDRKKADLELRTCVANTGEDSIAAAMYSGVRLGGYAHFPTSWKWGYGWVLERAYSQHSVNEKAQIEKLKKEIPSDYNLIPIASQPVVPERTSLTGDYCLDASIQQIEMSLNRTFQILSQKQWTEETSSGWFRYINVQTDGCKDPFEFSFHILRKNACATPMSELVARGRIRIRKLVIPKNCHD